MAEILGCVESKVILAHLVSSGVGSVMPRGWISTSPVLRGAVFTSVFPAWCRAAQAHVLVDAELPSILQKH